jgi:inner membrane transporter RhtA
VLTSLEPALASLSGMIFLHEFLSVLQWLAVICIILASFGAVATSRHPAATPELGV